MAAFLAAFVRFWIRLLVSLAELLTALPLVTPAQTALPEPPTYLSGMLGPAAPASAPPPPPVERSQDQRAATFRAWSQIPIMARAGKVAAAAEADSPPAAAFAQDPDDISEAVAAEGPVDISEAVAAYLESVKLQHVSALRFINPVYRRSALRPKPVMPVDAPLWIEPPGCTAAASSSTPRGGGGGEHPGTHPSAAWATKRTAITNDSPRAGTTTQPRTSPLG